MCWRRGSLLENAGFTRLLVFFCTFESLSIYQSKYLQQITMHSFRFFSSSATPATMSALFKKSTINHLSSRKRNIFWRCNRLRCHIKVLESSRHKNGGSYHLKSHRLRGENWKSRGADGFLIDDSKNIMYRIKPPASWKTWSKTCGFFRMQEKHLEPPFLT